MPDDLAYLSVDTPLGVFLVAERDGALKGGWFEGQKYFPAISPEAGWRKATTALLREAARQLDAYFGGELTQLDMPLAPEGTAFQQQVWRALCEVPSGETTTYAALARAIGRPEAFHPVGAAVGRNPISLFVPCHRALGSNGSLTGYENITRMAMLLGATRQEAEASVPGIEEFTELGQFLAMPVRTYSAGMMTRRGVKEGQPIGPLQPFIGRHEHEVGIERRDVERRYAGGLGGIDDEAGVLPFQGRCHG